MNSSTDSHAHENGVVHAPAAVPSDRRERLVRAAYAGASAGLRTFTVAATALRVKDNAWAPLVASLARAELIYDKLPATPSRLRPEGLVARVVSAAASGAAMATRKNPAWLPLAATSVAAALASAWIGATVRTRAAERNAPDLLLAALEDQIALHWAARAFPAPAAPVPEVPAVKTFSLL